MSKRKQRKLLRSKEFKTIMWCFVTGVVIGTVLAAIGAHL